MTGILVIDKPEGFTSHDVVAKLRGILSERRIGHTGTLDPMATGVLVMLVGRATRAMPFAETHDKEYVFGLRLGMRTDTYDIGGTVLDKCPCHVSRSGLETVLSGFRGDIMQVPPMYSAIKVDGKKMYSLARSGQSLELPPRPVSIHSLEFTDIPAVLAGNSRQNSDFYLRVSCSKGTYIRSLCHDIGEVLGCGGVMSYLRRCSVGDFTLDVAHSIDSVQALPEDMRSRCLLPLDRLFSIHPDCCVTAAQEMRIRNGGDFSCGLASGTYRVYNQLGDFLMLGKVFNGQMTTIKSFYEV